jgi:hypothetical protein
MKTYSELLNERSDIDDEDEAQAGKVAGNKSEIAQAKLRLADKLIHAGLITSLYDGMGGDWYDNSIELYNCAPGLRLTEEMQKVLFDEGFSVAYVNHTDGWETHYNWGKEFEKERGWRRRWVHSPTATTTNVLGKVVEASDRGYYEISYWPTGWQGQEDWLTTGYMRIVPDPLEETVDVGQTVD